MKKLLFLFLFGTVAAFAQYPTVNTVNTPGVGVGVPAGANFSDAAIHVKATDNDLYGNGGGQQIFFAETTASAAAGDYFRIMNSSGSNARFAPLISGFGRSHNVASLQMMGIAASAQDFGNSALVNFIAALDFTPKTSQEAFVNGNDVVNRPLFQWRNNQTPRMTMLANGSLGLGTVAPTAILHSVGTARLESLPSSSSNTDIITTDSSGNLASRPASSLFGPSGWSLTGNSGTNPLLNFIGTTDPQPLNFLTDSQQRMTIDSSGKLGLGTATPTGAALHILTGSTSGMLPPVIKLDRNDNTNQAGLLSIGISGSAWGPVLGGGSAYFKLEDPYLNSSNSDMGFSTNPTSGVQFVIKHNGFVGVGTPAPTANFHSIGTARLQGLPTSSSNTDVVTTDASGNLAYRSAASLLSTSWSLGGNAPGAADYLGTTNTNPINFKVNSVKSMSLDNGGNLSISTGGISTYQKLYVETNKQNDGIQVNQTGTTAATMDLNASGGAGRRWALHSTGSGNSQGAGHLLFWDWTSNQERMRIDDNGSVRIGNVPILASGYKLYVEQGILTEKVKVALSSSLAWADYVFAKDYKLQPLAEVESFINTNKHLPNMPSATELAKEGLDLGKMQAKQMEKIEELTLYLIQMQKEIDTLKKQNELLKSKN